MFWHLKKLTNGIYCVTFTYKLTTYKSYMWRKQRLHYTIVYIFVYNGGWPQTDKWSTWPTLRVCVAIINNADNINNYGHLSKTARYDRPSHISRAGDYLVVIEKPATWQIAVVTRQFTAHSHVALTCLQTVYWTNVVEAATCHKVARRRIRTRHYPARPQWNCVYLQNSLNKMTNNGHQK